MAFGAGRDTAAGLGDETEGETSGAWNQLCRQEAQRTRRPLAPIALSGTT